MIFGGMDPLFPKENVKEVAETIRVTEIPDADHALETGDIEKDIAILNRVVSVYHMILKGISD